MTDLVIRHDDRAATIARQNDRFRTRPLAWLARLGGRAVLTAGVSRLDHDTQQRLVRAVVAFDQFTPANDPHGEHDFGVVLVDDVRCFWKIDYYADAEMACGAEDARASYRVLTIMLAEEY